MNGLLNPQLSFCEKLKWTENKTKYFRLRLSDEESLKTLETLERPKFGQVFIKKTDKWRFAFIELLSEPVLQLV